MADPRTLDTPAALAPLSPHGRWAVTRTAQVNPVGHRRSRPCGWDAGGFACPARPPPPDTHPQPQDRAPLGQGPPGGETRTCVALRAGVLPGP